MSLLQQPGTSNLQPGLLFRLSWHALRASPGLAWLNVLGVSVGISIVLAVQVSNRSVLAAFRSTINVVAGRANVEVTADGVRFDEKVFHDVVLAPGVEHATPIVEAVLLLPEHRGHYLRLIGMDLFSYRPFLNFQFNDEKKTSSMAERDRGPGGRIAEWMTDPEGVAITEELGKKLNLPPGSTVAVSVDGKRHSLRIREWLRFEKDYIGADEHVAVMDIASAQELLGAVGELSRIDVISSVKPAELLPQLQPLLPSHVAARLPDRRGSQIAGMLGAFQLNLFALSLIAILVAGFLLHATMTTLVVRQRRSIGILRSMGLTPIEVRLMVLMQAVMVGGAGIIAGTLLGLVIARASMSTMSQAVSAVYLLVHTERLAVEWGVIGILWLMSFVVILFVAWHPAGEAAEVRPTEALSVILPSSRLKARRSALAWLSLSLMAIGAACSYGALYSPWAWLGFIAAFLWMLALACWMPAAISVFSRFMQGWVRRGRGGSGDGEQPPILAAVELGFKNLTGSLSRSSISAAALMTAFSMMLGTSIMIDSFRSTVEYWTNGRIVADVYVTPAANIMLGRNEAFPEEIVQGLRGLKGLRDLDTYHELWLQAPFASRSATERKFKLSAIDFRVIEKQRHFAFKGTAPTEFATMGETNGVLVNESFAFHYRKKIGDRLTLPTPSGKVDFQVRGIFFDYTTDSGLVLLDQRRYAALWKDHRIYSMALYLDGTREPAEVKEEILKRFGGELQLAIFLNKDLRAEILRVFDQTFAITLTLRLVTVAVATLGVFLTLATLIAERAREMAITRALGLGRREVLWMAATEAASLGGLGWFMGCIGGMGLSWLLAFVINRAYFGWTIQWRLDPQLLIMALCLAVPSALIAGLLAGFRGARKPIVEALRYE